MPLEIVKALAEGFVPVERDGEVPGTDMGTLLLLADCCRAARFNEAGSIRVISGFFGLKLKSKIC